MSRRPRKKPVHAPKGVVEGGQFIGKSSILHGLVRLLSGGGVKGSVGKKGSLTLDPRQEWKRPRLLAQARKRGVKLKRGAEQRDIVAALRARSKADAGVAPAAAPRPKLSTFGREVEALHDKQAKALLDNWDAVGELHGLNALALFNGLDPAVLERLAKARGLKSVRPLGLAADARRAAVAKGLPIRDHGDIPPALAALPLVWDFRGGAPPAPPSSVGRAFGPSGVAEALARWRRGSGPSEPFQSFETDAMRALVKRRGLALPRKPGRTQFGIALLSDERRRVRSARARAADPAAGVMPGAPIVDGESRFHRDISDVQDIADGVAQGVAKKKMANQGFIGETWIETLKNGLRVIHKWSKREHAGADARTQADGEQLASMLGRAIGAPVPRVFRHNETEIYMDFIPDANTGEDLGHGMLGDSMPASVADSEGARRIGIVDLLTNNFDRHSANYMVDDQGQVWGIDHGLAWAPGVLQRQNPRQAPAGDTPFLAHFAEDNGPFGGYAWKRNPYTQAEWAQMRQQVEALRPDFDRLGRGHWHEFAMKRIDELAEHASDAPGHVAAPPPAPPRRRNPFGTPPVFSGPRFKAPGTRAAAALAQPTPTRLARGRRLPAGVGVQTAAAKAIVAVKRKPAAQARGILRGQPIEVLRQMALALNMNRGDVRGMKRDQLINELARRI